jgi:hypothetical protein
LLRVADVEAEVREADAVPRALLERLLRLELEDLEHGAAGTRIQPILQVGAGASTPKNARTRSVGVSDTPTSGQPKTSQ